MSLTAYLTTERRVVRVRAHVVSEVFFARILLATGLTMMGGFSCMPHNMVHKVFFASKALLANITSMWSLTSVFANVIYHVLFSGKCLRAVLASTMVKQWIWLILARRVPGLSKEPLNDASRHSPIRCFPGVASRMVIQVFLPGEALAANRAVVRLVRGVSLHVTFQRGCVREDMKADCAREHGAT